MPVTVVIKPRTGSSTQKHGDFLDFRCHHRTMGGRRASMGNQTYRLALKRAHLDPDHDCSHFELRGQDRCNVQYIFALRAGSLPPARPIYDFSFRAHRDRLCSPLITKSFLRSTRPCRVPRLPYLGFHKGNVLCLDRAKRFTPCCCGSGHLAKDAAKGDRQRQRDQPTFVALFYHFLLDLTSCCRVSVEFQVLSSFWRRW